MIGNPNNPRRLALREQERKNETKRLRLLGYPRMREEANRLKHGQAKQA